MALVGTGVEIDTEVGVDIGIVVDIGTVVDIGIGVGIVILEVDSLVGCTVVAVGIVVVVLLEGLLELVGEFRHQLP